MVFDVVVTIVTFYCAAGGITSLIYYLDLNKHIQLKVKSDADTMVNAISAIAETIDSVNARQRPVSALSSQRSVTALYIVDLKSPKVLDSDSVNQIQQSPNTCFCIEIPLQQSSTKVS